MAIFVEGQTERIFVEGLIKEMAGKRQFHIDSRQGSGGGPKGVSRTWLEIDVSTPHPKTELHFAIYASMCDNRVLSDIRDQYATLTAQEFDTIIGVRDVYPLSINDVPFIRSEFIRYSSLGVVSPELILEIMEIEAWFIGEHTHFARMSGLLTPTKVANNLGYDPSVIDPSSIPRPYDDLRAVYAMARVLYKKRERHVKRTVAALSYEEIYVNLRQRAPDLDRLIQIIDDFLIT
jgi:hypothetical protein